MSLIAKFINSRKAIDLESAYLAHHDDVLRDDTLVFDTREQKNLGGRNLARYENYFRNLQKREEFIEEMQRDGEILADDEFVRITAHKNVVLKIPKSESTDEASLRKNRLKHEAFIGLRVINKLRAQGIYNFPWTYSFHERQGKPFLLMEQIHGVTLVSLIRNSKVTREELTSICNQLYCALTMAHDQFAFTHYDLHEGNVIIVKISDAPFHLKYHLNGEDVFVWSPGTLAVIIDYESAYVKIEGVSHGAPLTLSSYRFADEINRSTNHSYPQSDIFRLMSSIMWYVHPLNDLYLWLKPHMSKELEEGPSKTVARYMERTTFNIPDNDILRQVTPLEMMQELGMLLKLRLGRFEKGVEDYLLCENEEIIVVSKSYTSEFVQTLEHLVREMTDADQTSEEVVKRLQELEEKALTPQDRLILEQTKAALCY